MSWPKLRRPAPARCRVAVAALAVLLPALLAVPLASATRAYAAPTHVAIVIAGDKSVCVPWQSGMTGDSLLNEVAHVTYRSTDHLITQIDYKPTSNTATTSAYWAYWHNTGGGWTYSSVGASDYSVPVGSVEGWIFGDGSSPPSGSYASICAGQDPVTQAAPSAAAANPQTTSAQRASGTTPAATAVGGSAGSADSAGGSSSPGSAPADTPHSSAPRAPAKSAARSASRTAARPTVTASTPTTPTTTVQTDAVALAKPAAHRSANSALGAAVAALSVLALAAGAFWARRRRGSV